MIYFEVVTTLGLIIGAVAMNLSGAGWGIAIPAVLEGAAPAAAQAPQTWQQIILNLFPNNIAEAVAQNQILQVAIFSILFGSALAMLPDQKRAPLVSVLQSLADVMFQMTRFIMYLAPLAAGAAIAYTVGNTGLATLLPLAKLVVTYYIALIAFALLVMVPVMAAVSGSAAPDSSGQWASPRRLDLQRRLRRLLFLWQWSAWKSLACLAGSFPLLSQRAIAST